MPKRESSIPFILCTLYIIPIILYLAGIRPTLVASISFAVPYYTVNIIVTAILTLGAAAVTVLNRNEIHGFAKAMYFVTFAVAAVFYLPFCVWVSSVSALPTGLGACDVLCLFVCCTAVLPRVRTRIIFLAASAIPMIIIFTAVTLSLFVSLFPIGTSEIIAVYLSPNEEYRLEVTEYDAGATGGDTAVTVHYEKPLVHLGLVKIMKNPETLYTGNWHERISISWVDNDTVSVNGKLYKLR